VHFTKLRVSGFKSFIDPIELLIEPGMTGIVGPNGCGKSNVVEALRWVMGETSAKSMRGGGMEDVIFGGTTSRPARNIAEVILHIDNTDRKAPAMFNDADELEISRRIERDSGSNYRINGKDVRARDVQLLFADLATGAHSTAMVSQGRVSAMINAKPKDRRTLLEEAAGIKGLHSRRHEAELRLRAAETNLERLEDVIVALEAQHQGLQRQARQAGRYRRLSDQIRKFDAILLHHAWAEATSAVSEAGVALDEARADVATRTEAAAKLARMQADTHSALPGLRQAEAEAAATLQHLQLARRELDNEAERVAGAQARLQQQLLQIIGDIERETTLEGDASEALSRLETERGQLAAAQLDEAADREEAAAALTAANGQVEEKESLLHDLTGRLAETEARRESLTSRMSELAERVTRLSARETELEGERAQRVGALGADEAMVVAATALEEREAALEEARATQDASEIIRAAAEDKENAARIAAQEAQSALTRLTAEEQALAELLEPSESDLFPPVIDSIAVEAGYETALGAALGEDLNAPVDSSAPVHWLRRPPLDSSELPGGAVALAGFVKAPDELALRLSAIGVVENTAAATRLAPSLKAGQRLVSRDGGLWRWDGFTISAGAPTAAATQLAQRNRLADIRASLGEAEAKAEVADTAANAAHSARLEAAEQERTARETVRNGFADLNEARQVHNHLTNARMAQESRLTALIETLETTIADRELAQTGFAEAEGELSGLDDLSAARETVAALRTELVASRAEQAERRSAHDRLVADAERRSERLLAIETEADGWRRRASGAAERLADLLERRGAAEEERERLAARPDEMEGQRSSLMDQISSAETNRGAAADQLATAEAAQIEADRQLKVAEATLGEAREQQVRAEARVEQAERDRQTVTDRVREKLAISPENILAAAEIGDSETIPPVDAATTRLERLTRERDGMGPVNLRAETEADELQEQITTMQTEREDLLAAIARLRQGIGALNREGRERLMAAFSQVNGHFQDLFTKLFGGGRAHLTLTEEEDPLEAGLEIMASPPGKKLTSMSLLSGGEQALTAVSLLFAVFLTNPAPICVLDEVDAPLDDSNVDRFCSLLNELSDGGATRFLVVTHHRMSMARMDRLFGVTMGEPGVSQLVSVDLARAEALRESA
jgi:chromosome segregation protein